MSSFVIEPIITKHGIAAALDASGSGIALKITHVSVGSGLYTATDTQIALQHERDRVPVKGGTIQGDNQFQVDAIIEGPPHDYSIYEVGFWFETILFAVWSGNTPYSYNNYPSTNVGNGTLTVNKIGTDVLYYATGNYQLICSQHDQPGLEQFNVITPAGTTLGVATVGTEFTSSHLDFLITPGTVNFQTGDQIQITVHEHRLLAYKAPITPVYLSLSLLLAALPANSVTIEVNGPSLAEYDSQIVALADSQIQQDLRDINFNDRLLLLEA